MSTAIIISSSPTATFALSQTSVEISSPPGSPTNGEARQRVYKAARTTRDSFSANFTTAKQVLGIRSSAENIPIGSPGATKFKPPSSVSPAKFRPPALYLPIERSYAPKQAQPSTAWDEIPDCASKVVRILPSDVKKKKKTDTEPLQLKKAVARRKDWTPTKPTSAEPEQAASRFSINLTESFGHSLESTTFQKTANVGDGALTKRRKIDTIAEKVPVLTKSAANITKPRSKSSAKKGLTITRLATSAYLPEDKAQGTLMTQWMASTQARMGVNKDGDFEVKVKKKATTKTNKVKSRLRSPETALKTLDSQEVLFASASQVARDESPTFVRDTAEALKQSMESLSSPVLTQHTIHSNESITPQKIGTARWRSRKSLWTAADRDADLALLHMDDLDTPKMSGAFVGKDALFEHAAPIPDTYGPGDSLGLLAALNPEHVDQETTTFDIDDVTTPTVPMPNPAIAQTRSYSTLSRSPSSKRTKEPDKIAEYETGRGEASPAKKLAKPNYASWTDEQLKEKVKTYGFKRIRARKTMIDKLDEVWAEQHGVDSAKVKAATKAASQTKKVLQGGDILGTVHALAARPTPKVKKLKAKKSKVDEDKPKRKGKSKVNEAGVVEISTDQAIDVDELDNSNAFDKLAQMNAIADDVMETFEPSTAPVKGTGVKATNKKKRQLLTPPPTIPPKPTQDSSPAFASPGRRRKSPAVVTSTSSQNGEASLKSLIPRALEHPPADDATRNHQTDPTWQEKIYMFDPIVFEDFTAWLNTEGFNAIEEDGEIDIIEVKDWCHKNGVCSLWRGGWRGNKKTKETDEE